MDSFDDITSADYAVPSNHLLLSRVRTEGVVSHSYDIDGAIFEIFDVGGQRYFRKTWFDCFEVSKINRHFLFFLRSTNHCYHCTSRTQNVTAIIFVASLSEFDQMLAEDKSKNRMTEGEKLSHH